MRPRLILLISLLFVTIVLGATADQSTSLRYGWEDRFTETLPPLAPVRPIAEFEPASHVLIRYPLGIPTSLVMHLSNTADVICLVGSNSQMNSATSTFTSAGVNMDRVSFMVAPTDSYWTRDFGPWFIYDGNGDYAVVDTRYNRPRPNDNNITQLYAQVYDLPYYGMSLYQTGGNYMTDGINTAAQTDIAYSENSNNQTNVNNKMLQYLGITSYHVLDDPNNTYIDHIDCWGKFLAPDKVLIRSVPTSHAQYDEIEATADYFAGQTSAWGYPYKVYRVSTPGNQPYTNSLILNKKVFVPQMGGSYDAAALQVYRDAMPGYEVIGVSGTYSEPWESTDALHCRTHEIPDADMLHIAHQPIWGTQIPTMRYELAADITAHSGAELYADSIFVRYKVNGNDWQFLPLSNAGAMHYSGSFGAFSVGDTIRYYIHAADQSGRSANHPVFAELDPHLFVIAGDSQAPQLTHNPITSIPNAETTFILIAEDDTGIASAEISYRIDGGEVQSMPMLDAGNGLFLFLYEPDFAIGDQFFYYRVSATDNSGNTAYLPGYDTWYSASIEPTSVADNHQSPALSLKLYPNPVRQGDDLRIAFSQPKARNTKIKIYNLRGQLVYEQKGPVTAQSEIRWAGVDNRGQMLASGIYFLRAELGREVLNRKLIIAR